jgi:nucleoside-diphosphate-sugar epimerase
MVFLSSCKVYGEQALRDVGGNPLPFERHSPLRPTGPYGETKLAAEMRLTTLYEKANAALTILRPPLIYGPGNKANLLALMRAIARGWPLPLGAITNRRSLLFVGNLADAIGLALLRDAAGVRAYPLSDIELATPDLVRALAAGMGRRARLLPLPTPCLKLARRALGKASRRRKHEPRREPQERQHVVRHHERHEGPRELARAAPHLQQVGRVGGVEERHQAKAVRAVADDRRVGAVGACFVLFFGGGGGVVW